jgi:hypothetical protein
MVIGLLALFVGWVLYRWLVKRDLKEHKGTLVLGLMFIGVWGLLYGLLWS